MPKSTLKRRMRFPRCLVCSHMLFLRRWNGKPKKTVECPKCGILYARNTLVDADPERWKRMRERQLFKVYEDSHGRRLLRHDGFGSRRTG